MKKILLILLIVIPFNIFAINLYSTKYLIYDNTDDKILLEKDIDKNTSIASLTKIMTAMVIIDNVPDLNKKITITKEMLSKVPNDAFIINLKRGESYTYQDLLYAALLPSAADAAISLSIGYSGNINNFVSAMNKKAKELGMNNTFFTNPIGMDNKNNKGTLKDVLTLLKYALDNETFRAIYTTKKYTMNYNKTIYSSLKMYNEDLKLNLDTTRMLGTKTGHTNKAGLALSQIFQSNNHEIISITIGAKYNKNSYHLRDGLSIIRYIDDNYNNQVLIKANTLVKELKVRDSTIDQYYVYSDKDIIKYLANNYNKDDFKIKYNLPEYITYKTRKYIGNIMYYLNDELLYNQIVSIDVDIKPNFISIIKDNILYIALGILFIIVNITFVIAYKKSIKQKTLP